MLRVRPIAVIFFIFGIIFTSIHGGRGAPLPPPEELLTTSTVPLENLSLAPGDFIILADSTPVPIESAHVSMNVPCRVAVTAEGNNITTSTTNSTLGPSSDIKIMAGVAPDLKIAIPEYIAGLSRPEISKCTYHVQLPQVVDQQVTDILIINTGNRTVKFGSGNFATISTSSGGTLTQEENLCVDLIYQNQLAITQYAMPSSVLLTITPVQPNLEVQRMGQGSIKGFPTIQKLTHSVVAHIAQ